MRQFASNHITQKETKKRERNVLRLRAPWPQGQSEMWTNWILLCSQRSVAGERSKQISIADFLQGCAFAWVRIRQAVTQVYHRVANTTEGVDNSMENMCNGAMIYLSVSTPRTKREIIIYLGGKNPRQSQEAFQHQYEAPKNQDQKRNGGRSKASGGRSG